MSDASDPNLQSAPKEQDPEKKLFVGNIPYEWNESSLKSVFVPYGEITETVVLKDKPTGTSKGCGFVIFAQQSSAANAIAGLNDRQLPNCPKPLIVRLAGARPPPEAEHKLFVCMLSRSTTEVEMRTLFLQFGEIVDIHLMKDASGFSKGQGFVKFKTSEAAQKAIETLNNKYTDKDAIGPVEVRYAQLKTADKKNLGPPGFGGYRGGMGGFGAPRYDGGYGQRSPYGVPQQALSQHYGYPSSASGYPPSSFDPYSSSSSYSGYSSVGYTGQPSPVAGGYNYGQLSQQGQGQIQQQQLQAGQGVGGVRDSGPRGPEGANLFVHGLSEDFSEPQLRDLFSPFGNLISVKINMDPATNRSKGFGFVSFSNAQTAYTAMTALDGIQIGQKRIQVKIKQERPKPY